VPLTNALLACIWSLFQAVYQAGVINLSVSVLATTSASVACSTSHGVD